MSEDVMASDVDTATKMITDSAADDVECIFGTAFKEEMNDEMSITVIAAGFDSIGGETVVPTVAPVQAKPVSEPSNVQEVQEVEPVQPVEPTPVDKSQNTNQRLEAISTDDDLDDIYKLLDNY
jgi:cell division protein FtsZ